MKKKTKYNFNQQLATRNLLAESIVFAISNPRLDDLYNMEFGPTDYIEKDADIYYVATPNEYDRFLDFAMSKGFDVNKDVVEVDNIKEMSTSSAAGAYNPSLHASKKKINPFKEQSEFFESVLSGYKELTGFKPGHTPDKGGFQYKDLWAEDACWDGYQQIGMKDKDGKQVPNCVPIEEMDVNDPILMKLRAKKDAPVTQPKSTNPNQTKINMLLRRRAEIERDMEQEAEPAGGPIADRYASELTKIDLAIKKLGGYLEESNKLSVLEEMGDIIDETFTHEDYRKIRKILDKIKYTNTKLYNQILDMLIDIQPHTYDEIPQSQLSENYSRFKNETKTRTKPEQFHQAVKSVKRKVEEISKLYEYMERLKMELSESEEGLKYRKYTENAIAKIKESVKQLHLKTKKLK